MARDFPESEEAAYWRRVNTAVPLTFAALATVAYALRVYATLVLARRVRVEDFFMGCAVLLMIGNTASVLLKAFNGIGVPDKDLPHYRQVNFKLGSWLVIKFWSASMIFAKLAIILFLRRVTGVNRTARAALDILAVLVVIWGASNFFYTTWFCKPVAYYWDRSIEGGWCVDNDLYMIESKIIASTAVAMDVAMLSIPIPTIWHLQIRLRQKIGITFILCIGVVVCVFSLLRAVQFSQFDTANLSTSSILEGLWTVLENYFTVLCGCLPQLGPLFRRSTKEKEMSSGPGSGYLGSYDASKNVRSWGFQKMSAIETSVCGAHDAPVQARYNSSKEQHNSSELELKGIEVQTTIDQEISIGTRSDDEFHIPLGGRG
ncbi:hypothetical protein H634G_08495 [Metarhizium anisopliae BRIP 53293]|uniref:Rhodopsin domain-containing protein n=1 Tax=Metarhizium anisopliae BRIP 53293 TaxID=1291518 RepID=A0A0D9NQ62_METAN|nr:hypothetical protein H634G_08495 [Metarhizium anisopliae BRIP 53293]KJK91992.1 hypothetical protein H633G_04130 [Metarhizium anisopliae BRIP 53284]